MRIALGSDEDASVVSAIEGLLAEAGHAVVGRFVGMAWPDAGRAVGEEVARGSADRGVVCCWTGTGVSIAANKVSGVRAALCVDAATASGARRWNDANVLALSLRSTTDALAEEILTAFLDTPADEAERELVDRVERPAPGGPPAPPSPEGSRQPRRGEPPVEDAAGADRPQPLSLAGDRALRQRA
ncbi:MAG TPA: RpiB/LacA/LacB family sugar-phosphate isomerase [Acidimicrobiales bacterium]|nr:RpiB/LacA/LacB family sugar-phosphate isomerase [Acidimicrobiales bacterium]